jgi:ring-1,2-phenylacetyl-CoA epoxidase subunit PaaB
MKSLDPRVERLPSFGTPGPIPPRDPLDQFGTFEVFVQAKEGKAFQHEGIVHAPNIEMAYVLAKETFTRRFTCASLYVVETDKVCTSATTEDNESVYEKMEKVTVRNKEKVSFEIYHLQKRGKQHIHAGTLEATAPEEAMTLAKDKFNTGKIIYNVWAIRSTDIRFTSHEEHDLWSTLPDKKFRDAAEYKGGEKLKVFLEGRR